MLVFRNNNGTGTQTLKPVSVFSPPPKTETVEVEEIF
jgi:hypothetical protein